MEIVREYVAEYNPYGDIEKIVITKYSNGKFYIHYGWIEKYNQGAVIAGRYDSIEAAEKMLLKHRPTAKSKIGKF